MGTIQFDPGLHELRFKGVDDACHLVFRRDFLVCKESFAGIVKLAEIGNHDSTSRQKGRLICRVLAGAYSMLAITGSTGAMLTNGLGNV